MQEYFAAEYDVVVVGAGHAGIEAGLASARLGCRVCVFTINMDWVGNMPCNPSIGGTAKGHLVREIDALGGEMGLAADECTIQSRMLNRGKGPAVHSLRAQVDRRAYAGRMKHTLEQQPNLDLKQAELIDLRKAGAGDWEVVTRLGAVYRTRTVILATGTFLDGRIFVGEVSYPGGPDGMFAATAFSSALEHLGIRTRRFKTGTPARVHRASICFEELEEQPGDEPVTPFSFETTSIPQNQTVCHITWTNAETKQVILKNLHRSPLYSGQIEGIGPRYCPSIEDKVVRFADKERHQVFIEPCGLHSEELYLQGVSSSLPEEVQLQVLRTIGGLGQVEVMRTAYAIEYDCIDPTQLQATLQLKEHSGLFGAGQINGSSGYEEAAAQGLVAGINAALSCHGKDLLVLDRASSYIGTLIDDLVTKGCTDPYRMMTSRSEYRLVLRQDNADERLTPTGRRIGLVTDARWQHFERRQQQKRQELERIEKTVIPPSEQVNNILVSCETSPITTGIKLMELLKRPQLGYEKLTGIDTGRPDLPNDIFERCEIEVKYAGYIQRQQAQIDEMRRLENKLLPDEMDYSAILGLRLEARDKLTRIQPRSVGQASRISGVSPADISVLLIWLSAQGKKANKAGGTE